MKLAAKLAVAAAFWGAVFLVQKFNWDLGGWKALALLALLLGLPFLIQFIRRRAPAQLAVSYGLAALVAILLAGQLAYFGARVIHPRLTDMATTTLAAGAALLHGENPYLLPIDTEAAAVPGGPAFQGYKYLPVMAAVYVPLGTGMGESGVLITNLLLHLATLFVIARLARASNANGLVALALYLALPLVPQQILAKGDTDPAAILPLLAAFLCLDRRPGIAGFLVGLSIATKLLPGAAFVVCLVPATVPARWRYAVGLAVGVLPILPFALLSPDALYDNILLFNSVRPPDSTSWLALAPSLAAPARAAFLALFLGVTALVWRRRPSLAVRCGLGAILAIGAILSGPAAHHNYQLWWLPFYCVVLAAAFTRTAPETCQAAGLRYTSAAQVDARGVP
jgi:hypothetical protein